MKINKKKLKTIDVSILNDTYKVYVYIGDRELANKKICEYVGENNGKEFLNPDNRGKSVHKWGLHPCIWIDGDLNYKDGIGTLSHEAVHSVSAIMEYLAMDMRDLSGNEFLAHSVGAIVRKVLQEFNFTNK
jgi:hypothetical protein